MFDNLFKKVKSVLEKIKNVPKLISPFNTFNN